MKVTASPSKINVRHKKDFDRLRKLSAQYYQRPPNSNQSRSRSSAPKLVKKEARTTSRKISDVYKNPQVYTGMWQNMSPSQWNFPRVCLLLFPTAFALQFSVVVPAIGSVANLLVLGVPLQMAMLHYCASGILGGVFIFGFQRFVKRYYINRKRLLMSVSLFFAYLAVGYIFVLLANIQCYIKFSEQSSTTGIPYNETTYFLNQINKFNSQKNAIGHDNHTMSNFTDHQIQQPDLRSNQTVAINSEPVLSLAKTLAFVGYAFLASSLGTGQYLLQSVAMTSTHHDNHQHVVVISTCASGVGGCVASVIGVLIMHFNQPVQGSLSGSPLLLPDVIIILCTIGLLFLLFAAICFWLSWRQDTRDLRATRLSAGILSQPKARRPSRTAQEIFDECAHLLGRHPSQMQGSAYHTPQPESNYPASHHHPRIPKGHTESSVHPKRQPKYYDPEKQRFVPVPHSEDKDGNTLNLTSNAASKVNSPDCKVSFSSRRSYADMLDNLDGNSSYQSETSLSVSESKGLVDSTDIVKRYVYPVANTPTPSRKREVVSLFSSPTDRWKVGVVAMFVVCLFTSSFSFEMSCTIFLTANTDKNIMVWQNIHYGILQGSESLLLTYVIFTVCLLLYNKFQARIGWRKITLAACLLSSLMTLFLVVTNAADGLVLSAAAFHGILRVMILAMPHFLTLQTVHSQYGYQTESRRQLLIETPTTFLWSLMPLSLALVGAIVLPITYTTSRPGTPMMYSSISGFVACLGFVALL